MAGELLLDHPLEGVLRLTVSNPAKRGALDHPILDSIAAAVRDAATDGTRAIVVTGEDGTFSSGYDIGEIDDDVFETEAERLVAHPYASAVEALRRTELPTLAVLGGHAIGGGLELAVSCDLRLAAEGIALGMPPAKLGLVYSHTGLRRFLDVVGEPRTRELFLLGRTIDAGRAEAWGLVNRVVPAEELEAAALDWAAELAANAPLSVRGNKRVLRALLDQAADLPGTVATELLALRRASFASEDLREGLAAFAAKRPARWRGR